MIPKPFLGISSGFFLSFFALLISDLVGSVPNTRKRLSAVKTGRSKRACPATNSAALAPGSSGGGTGGRYPRGARHSVVLATLRTTISPSPSCGTYAIGDELTVAGNLGCLNRSPRVVVFVSERAFYCGRLGLLYFNRRQASRGKRNCDCCQQTDYTNQRCSQTERGSSGRRYSEAHGDHLTNCQSACSKTRT